MSMFPARTSTLVAAATLMLAACATQPQSGPMSFFITSQGSGKGADFGGLAGADAHCQRLAARGRRRRQDLARLSQRTGDLSFSQFARRCFGQCARSHRPGPLAQRQGPVDRE
jgi:hypothetical protein